MLSIIRPERARARRRWTLLLAGVLASGAVPRDVDAQMRGAYLPLRHPAHAVAELLVRRGVLQGLDGMQRPYALQDLRRSIRAARGGDAGADPAELDWLAEVVGEPVPAGEWSISVAPEAGVSGATSAFPELLLAEGDSALALAMRLRIGAEFGPASIQFEPERVQDGRAFFPAALAAVRWTWGRIEWGKLDRNWGPTGVSGLLIAPLTKPRAEFGFTLGPQVLQFEYRVAPLSDGVSSDTGETVGRTWAMHRLRWRPSRSVELAIWETTLAPEPGGADAARFSPLTPFSFPFQQGIEDGRNVTVGVDALWSATPLVTLEGQLLIDDVVRRNRGSEDNPYPQRYGYVLQLRGPVAAGSSWRVYATALSGLALNTFAPEDAFLHHDRGLGRLRPDHREFGAFWTVPWDFAPRGPGDAKPTSGPGIAELGVKWRRQGIRRFTDPFPDLDVLPPPPRYPAFSPEIEREVFALVGRLDWMPGPLTFQTETHLQVRRFPDAGGGWELGLESIVEVVWRVGLWNWSGQD